MDWLNIHTSTLDSPEFVGACPVERSTWLCLLRFSIGQENSGVIVGAADWADRRWQQLARVTLREVRMNSELWRWEGADLRVNFYPVAKQAEIEAKRSAGRDTVAKRWGKQTCSANSSACSSSDTEGELEGKGNKKENTPPLPPQGGELPLGEPATTSVVPRSPNSHPDPSPPTPKAKSPIQLRAERLMRRRESTPWTHGEARAFAKNRAAIEATTEDEWQALERFYAAPQSQTFSRKNLAQLVNNWNGEIDQAKAWPGQAPAGTPVRTGFGDARDRFPGMSADDPLVKNLKAF